MRVEWKYDTWRDGGSIEIDPEDYKGKSADEIRHAIYEECLDDARDKADAYVPLLSEAARLVIDSLNVRAAK